MRRIIGLTLLLILILASEPPAQIRGGAESATFEPGDRAIYQEDLSGTRIGDFVEGWNVVEGSYEVAEFQGRKWFRPLNPAKIFRAFKFPREFSIEFTVYLFKPGSAELRMYLHTTRENRAPGPDGPVLVELWINNQNERDGFRLMARSSHKQPLNMVAEDVRRLPPETPHQVALQVRGGRLSLFIDGQLMATTPFSPERPLQGLQFAFGSRGGHELPYKDRPALLDGLRIAEYTAPAGKATGGIRLYWTLPSGKDHLPPSFSDHPTLNDSLALEQVRKLTQWKDVTFVVIPLPANPFANNSTNVHLTDTHGKTLLDQLKKELVDVQNAQGGLVILGVGNDGHTERERKLLVTLRAMNFSTWLARRGIGDLNSLLVYLESNDNFEGLLFIPGSGKYMAIRY